MSHLWGKSERWTKTYCEMWSLKD